MFEGKGKYLFKKIINILILALFIVLILNLLTAKSEGMFRLFGYRSYTVLSGSMEPEFSPGDMVVVKHKNREDAKVNDILTFKDEEGNIITHRAINKTNEGFITKGDNNNVEDSTILKKENIIGKVSFSIPKVGYINRFLATPIALALGIILLGVYVMYYYKDLE